MKRYWTIMVEKVAGRQMFEVVNFMVTLINVICGGLFVG